MNYEEGGGDRPNSPLAEEADGVYVARRCAAQGDVARTDAVRRRWPSSQRRAAAPPRGGPATTATALGGGARRGERADLSGRRERGHAGPRAHWRRRWRTELLRSLPEIAVDRRTYLLAMRAHKLRRGRLPRLVPACEPATGEPVDEKLVVAGARGAQRRGAATTPPSFARDARRGIGLDDRGAAALVRAFRRSGDWQGALDLPG